jgi:hypothetical protein
MCPFGGLNRRCSSTDLGAAGSADSGPPPAPAAPADDEGELGMEALFASDSDGEKGGPHPSSLVNECCELQCGACERTGEDHTLNSVYVFSNSVSVLKALVCLEVPARVLSTSE